MLLVMDMDDELEDRRVVEVVTAAETVPLCLFSQYQSSKGG